MADQQKNTNNPNNGQKKPKFSMNWFYILVMAVLIGAYMFGGDKTTDSSVSKDASYTEFQSYVKQGFVQAITINNVEHEMELQIKPEHIREIFKQPVKQTGKTPVLLVQYGSADKVETFIEEQRKAKTFSGLVKYDNKQHSGLWDILISFGPILLLVLFWVFMFRGVGGGGGFGGGIFGVGKSKAKVYEKGEGTAVTFKDVAGQEGAKQEVQEIVEFLKNPNKFTELGGKIPKGALLVGPPGTGKTLLAKAVAGEAGVPFLSLSGSDFVEMFVGVGASRVRDLFRQAKEKSPCIIFIDEIDAVGRSRSKNPNMGGNDERENTLNALLTEMDGFGTNSGVIILAATNRADILDSALMRAGRFDRQISVELPDINERAAIFDVHLRPLKLIEGFDRDFLAKQTPGFSGADIANVCNEAALTAARKDKKFIEKQDFLDAIDRIVGGLEKKNKIITDDERKAIAYHEAGHASISWVLENAHPLVKVTIVPRGKALGAAWYLPEERQLTTKDQILDEMCSTLGGRAAEEVVFGKVSTGALNDLEKVTKQAYAMVTYYGLSEKIQNLSYYDSTGNNDYSFNRPYSEHRAEVIDEEVSKIVAEQYERAKQILVEHSEQHRQLAERLLEKEVIFSEDLEQIYGPRKGGANPNEALKKTEEASTESDQDAEEKPAEVDSEQKSE